MSLRKDCESIIRYNHNEIPAVINLDTGEIREFVGVGVKKEMRDKTMEYFRSNQPYQRFFTNAWGLLRTQTNDLEYSVAQQLGQRAKAYTNSLEPIKPESTMVYLSTELNIDRRKVFAIVDKLFKLGVIGKFEVYDRFEVHHNYWVFNPYLSFNGRGIKKDVVTLFDRTYYANL
jgi:hypothetical protein